MIHENLRQKLTLLQQLIHQERECAIQLRIEDLKGLQDKKGLLLMELQSYAGTCPEELKALADHLRNQNRRNARLLSTTLAFLRQRMNSCSREISTVMYGRCGNRIESKSMGLLHTGRI